MPNLPAAAAMRCALSGGHRTPGPRIRFDRASTAAAAASAYVPARVVRQRLEVPSVLGAVPVEGDRAHGGIARSGGRSTWSTVFPPFCVDEQALAEAQSEPDPVRCRPGRRPGRRSPRSCPRRASAASSGSERETHVRPPSVVSKNPWKEVPPRRSPWFPGERATQVSWSFARMGSFSSSFCQVSPPSPERNIVSSVDEGEAVVVQRVDGEAGDDRRLVHGEGVHRARGQALVARAPRHSAVDGHQHPEVARDAPDGAAGGPHDPVGRVARLQRRGNRRVPCRSPPRAIPPPSCALRNVTMPAEERNITDTAMMRMRRLFIPYYSAGGC